MDAPATAFRTLRTLFHATRLGRSIGRILPVLAAGLILIAGVARGQSTCLDYETFVHTIAGTRLPGTTTTVNAAAPGIVVMAHPFASGARLAFVTNSNGATGFHLTCVDVTDPDQLADPAADADQLADLLLPEPGTDIVVDPDFPARPYLYLSARDLDLIVVEVADADTTGPANRDVTLTILATRAGESIPNFSAYDANSLAIQARADSTLLFVQESGSGSANGRVRIYNAQDPANPQFLATAVGGRGFGGEIALNGVTAYMSNDRGLTTFNVRNALAPVYMGVLNVGPLNGLAVSGDGLLLVATGPAENSGDPTYKPLRVFDVSNPFAPVVLVSAGAAAGFDTPGGDLVVDGTHALIAGPDGLQVADLSVPGVPIVRGRASGMGQLQNTGLAGVAVDGDHAYVTGPSRGLRAIRLGSRTSPSTYSQQGFASLDMARADSGIVVACTDGLRVLDPSSPASPVVRGFVPLSPAGTSVTTIGNQAFVLRGTELSSWSLANPAAPAQSGTLPVSFGGSGGVALTPKSVGGSSFVYVAARWAIYVINVSNPAAMSQVRSVSMPEELRDVAVDGDRLYAVATSNVYVLSLTDPSNPIHVGTLDLPGEDLREITGDGAFAYAVGRNFHVVDTSIPASPALLSSTGLDEMTSHAGIAVDGTAAYVMNGSGGVAVLDLTDLAILLRPRRIGSLNPGGANYDSAELGMAVLVVDGVVYGADGNNGFWTAPTHCVAPGRTLCCVTPPSGGNAGEVQVIVSGFGLEGTDTVTLTRPGDPMIPGVILSTSVDQVLVQFNLVNQPAGAWSVLIHDPVLGYLTLENGFTIDEGGSPVLDVTLLGPAQLRGGSPSTYDVVVSNSGNIDGRSTILLVHGIPLDATVTIESTYALTGTIGSPGLLPRGNGRAVSGALGDLESPILVRETEQAIFIQAWRVPVSGIVTFRFTLNVPTGAPPFDLRAMAIDPGTLFNPALGQAGMAELSPGLRDWLIPASSQPSCQLDNSCLRSAVQELSHTLNGLAPATNGAACYTCGIVNWLKDWDQGPQYNCFDNPTNCRWFHANRISDFWYGVAKCLDGVAIDMTLEEIMNQIAEGLSAISDCAGAPADLIAGVEVLASLDPNDKVGPSGVTAQHHLPDRGRLYYTVMFENQPSATLPAREVRITDNLPTAALDATTLRFHQVGFGALVATFPAPAASFVHDFDLRPGQEMLVRVTGSVDVPTGVVSVFYQGLDLATGLPPTDPLVGWLPPNLAPPAGEGRVIFSVAPQPSVGDGSTVCNEASIVFDANPPIQTPAWCNVFDLNPPSSDVAPLDTVQVNPEFPVQWSGADATSGVLAYDIFVSVDGAPPVYWTRTNVTQKLYPGVPGEEYAFYSSAIDSAGNAEALEAAPDATTRVLSTSGIDEPRAGDILTFLARPAQNPARAPVPVTFGVGTADAAAGRTEARLGIYDVSGRLVRVLVDDSHEAGLRTVAWDGRDDGGSRVSSGLYFLRLQVGNSQFRQRIVFLR